MHCIYERIHFSPEFNIAETLTNELTVERSHAWHEITSSRGLWITNNALSCSKRKDSTLFSNAFCFVMLALDERKAFCGEGGSSSFFDVGESFLRRRRMKFPVAVWTYRRNSTLFSVSWLMGSRTRDGVVVSEYISLLIERVKKKDPKSSPNDVQVESSF
jgi:hypothetical protein